MSEDPKQTVTSVDIEAITKAFENSFETKLYVMINAVLKHVMAEMNEKIDKLKSKNDSLKAKIAQLETTTDHAEQ